LRNQTRRFWEMAAEAGWAGQTDEGITMEQGDGRGRIGDGAGYGLVDAGGKAGKVGGGRRYQILGGNPHSAAERFKNRGGGSNLHGVLLAGNR